MRSAPPLSVRVGGGVVWRVLQIGLPAFAAALVAHWGLAHAEASAPWMLTVPAATAMVGWLVARRRPANRTDLRWDGQQWSADGEPGPLDLMIDLQDWMLLRLRPAGGGPARWIAVEAAEAGAQMPLLRAALHARVPAGPAAAPGSGPAR